ncbi:Uncharacterised protein [Ectopseudomonas mendocina]|uniref:Uncharacterized protein n=1 Tax=Ectopseudomonas mendocina TaxID=300 RepID=A0A379PP62_ECTME|nr:hypothetical protein [Pseudomonas mendocina]SUE95783.1 Uncharacterised protein [Pseudomonas mendocina]
MACELIRVNFKKGVVKSREILGSEAPAYNPYQDENFKAFTAGVADLACEVAKDGGNPNKLVVIATDEDAEIDYSVFDQEVLSTEQVIAGLKRIVAKLENSLESQQHDPA